MSLFARRERPALVGVLHLPPLPGAPSRGPGLEEVERHALRDLEALRLGGADGVIVENLGDAPFAAERVDPWTTAALTRVCLAVRRQAPELALGINVLRNDALAALGIAHAVSAEFVRVNVLTGAMVTDQGWIEGRARDVLAARRWLDAEVRIAADVLVKHAVPPAPMDLVDVAADTIQRGGADAIIVSGTGTGRPTPDHDLARVRAALPGAPLWVGSGVTPEQAGRLDVDVAVVGTWLHRDGDLRLPLDVERVRALRRALER